MKRHLRSRFIGDRAFYRMVMRVTIPIMIQNGITNFVSLLDNIMVGRVGTEQMSGVAIVNQLNFVYALCIFGGLAGAGIFTAQYMGQNDWDGVRYTFRYKLCLGILVTAIAGALFLLSGDKLIGLYITSGDGTDAALTMEAGLSYLRVMLLGLPAFMLVQVYTSTLREGSETMLPMKAGIIAVFVNLFFNYLLIFGSLGFPKLGVTGAAVATVISRYVELAIVLIWTHTHLDRVPYIRGIYKSFAMPSSLVKRITVKGAPLLINEALWSSAQAFLVQCYSVRGLNVVAALNISTTISNLFNVVFLSLGSSVGIIVGQLLGADKLEEARDTDNKMIAFSVMIATGMALLQLLTAPLFPRIYNTSDAVRTLATQLMLVSAIFMPQNAFLNASYFTLRSGGKTVITFLFDSVSAWLISIPIAFFLSRYTGFHVALILAMVNIGDWIKCVLGYVLVKKGIWMHNIVAS
ncbi:MAG: MATE family efflux transporter [Clostridia bacterium]|nr:MATE family efflux transporter [Clostridia bacterium]MBR1685840.1 MATE family efflux transporter [Clostridia bacterium]MBR2287969.1 MATE family efflux transporter [Clostridia bacterium]